MTEHSDEGRVVTLGLRLRDRTVRKQLYITVTVQVMVTYFIKVAIPHIGRHWRSWLYAEQDAT